MKAVFNEINQVEDVRTTLLISLEGHVLAREANPGFEQLVNDLDWTALAILLQDTSELEIIFDHMRIYIRKASSGFLVVIMGRFANVSLVQLEVDVLLPQLQDKPKKKTRGLGRFFRSS